MKSKIVVFGIIAIFAGLLFAFSNTASADVIIIINNNSPDNNLSKNDIKKIYSGHMTKWSNNDTIILTVLPKAEFHKKFLREFVKKTPSQFNATWKKMVFTGKGRPPKSFKTIEAMVNYVAETDGAIGYVIADVNPDKVKIIKFN